MNKKDYQKVFKVLPNLTVEGLGLGMTYKANEDYHIQMEKGRERLLKAAEWLDSGNLVEYWLSHFTPKKSANNNDYGSYGLKHDCEDTIGVYVPNGLFIAVAHHLGFPINQRGLNPQIGIRSAELKKLSVRYRQKIYKKTFDPSLFNPHPLYKQTETGSFIIIDKQLVRK